MNVVWQCLLGVSRWKMLLMVLMLGLTSLVSITLSHLSLTQRYINSGIYEIEMKEKLPRPSRAASEVFPTVLKRQNDTSGDEVEFINNVEENNKVEPKVEPKEERGKETFGEYNQFLPDKELNVPLVKSAPFLPNRPHSVLLLSYQRSGSTFIADWLFGNRDDVFYLFEPLDGIYNAMYGVSPGWTIPSDVTTHLNGTLRIPPADEREAVTTFMKNVFTCDVTSLPSEMFLHKYALSWRRLVPSMEEYENCSRPVAKASGCYKYTRNICGERFGVKDKLSDMNMCKNILWNKQEKTHRNEWQESLSNYSWCIQGNMDKIEECIPKLSKSCSESPVRAMKTVRATMDEVEPLLKADPNFRLVHLYRDPRAVYRSRRHQSWTWSAFENSEQPMWKTASVYCQTALYDYKKRKELELKYPGKIKTIIYDQFMSDPEKAKKEIYDFIGMTLPPDSESEKKKEVKRAINPLQNRKQAWENDLKPDLVRDIELTCQEFADVVGATWRKLFQNNTLEENKPKEELEQTPVVAKKMDPKTQEAYNMFLPEKELTSRSVKPVPFIAGHPRSVLLLSYQRSGSTFIADWLFGNRDDVFYLFEPLDGIYNAMYGVSPGWTIPSDVTTHLNGTLRIPPADEREAVTTFMKNVFTCDVTSLPSEMFLHKYALSWRRLVPSMEEYENCSRPVAKASGCNKHTRKICGERFGVKDKINDMNMCKNILWNKKENITTKERQESLSEYSRCIDTSMNKIQECIPKLSKSCSESPVRAMKTVRATMDEVEPLLKADPNFRLVHLYRDPRAVYRSRRHQSWTWSAFENSEQPMWKTASVYCQTALYDYNKRKELELKYPGKIKTIIYDQFMSDPEKAKKEIYDFIGMTLPPDSESKKKKEVKRAINPLQNRKQAWEKDLKPDLVRDIELTCQEFADVVGATWRKPFQNNTLEENKPKEELEQTPVVAKKMDPKTQEAYNMFLPEKELTSRSVKPVPFIAGHPRSVLLLSYQRSGSTFIADWLFGNRDDVFYLFEPLDGIYNAMYGVSPGWTIPSDVTTHLNGTLRIPPADEREAVTTFMKNVFTCDVTSLPSEMFLHKYALSWRRLVPSMEEYENCSRPVAKASGCNKHTRKICGERFGVKDKINDMNMCKNILWNKKENITTKERQESLSEYSLCIDTSMNKIQECIPKLSKSCSESPVRAMKTVRATMDEVEPLLKADPNFRLLHLYRDPRAVYRSRRHQSWTWSAFENSEQPTWKTASVYCQTALYDYKKRKELEQKYPGKIKTIIYDQFMLNPEQSKKEIYDFMGMKVDNKKGNEEELKRPISPRIRAKQAWEKDLKPDLVRNIEFECQALANAVGVKWRRSNE